MNIKAAPRKEAFPSMNLTADVAAAFQAVRATGPSSWEAEFAFPADLPVFRGHFPGHPIVPGVYQLGCMLEAFRRGSGFREKSCRIKTAKFLAVVEPPCRLQVRITAEIRDTAYLLRAEVSHQGTPSAVAVIEAQMPAQA